MYQDLNFWRTPMDARPLSIGAKDKGEQKGVSPEWRELKRGYRGFCGNNPPLLCWAGISISMHIKTTFLLIS